MCGPCQVFPNEMPVFLREHDSGAYRVSSFFFGRTVVSDHVCLGGPLLESVRILFWVLLQTVAALVSMGVSCVGQGRAVPCGRRNPLARL